MLKDSQIIERLQTLKSKLIFLKNMVIEAKRKKGKDFKTPILNKRIFICVAEIRTLEWVLENGS